MFDDRSSGQFRDLQCLSVNNASRLECLGLNEPDRRPKILMLDARIPPVVVSVCLVLSLRKVEGRGSQCVSPSAGASGMRYSTCTLAIY